MIKVSELKVASFDISYLDIFWTTDPHSEDENDYRYIIERSPNQLGPFYAVSPEIVGNASTWFRDYSVEGQHSIYHQLWYRIRVTHRVTNETTTYPEYGGGVKLEAQPNLYALEMAREENLRLQVIKGRLLWIFPRRRSGQRCAACFDAVQQRRVRSSCPTCFDTGFAGGYYNPIECYGQIITPSESHNHSQQGKMEAQQTFIYLGNFPDVSEGDLVVEAENVRWKVGIQITKPTLGRYVIRQQALLVRISPNDIEQRIPIRLTSQEVRDLKPTPLMALQTNIDDGLSDELVTSLAFSRRAR